MNKTLIRVALVAAMLGALSVSPALAQTASTTPVTTNNSTVSSAVLACVSDAVNVRETAIDAAMTTYTAAVNAAYTTRASALKAAYSSTSVASIKAGIKAAWSAFNTSVRTARAAQPFKQWRIFSILSRIFTPTTLCTKLHGTSVLRPLLV